ncbi:MAG: hypothetical protein WC325_08410 [Candidatus Bathyarchaeia archaeon]|jgi:DNA-binding winged helix-turn-helix (wHTH) protein
MTSTDLEKLEFIQSTKNGDFLKPSLNSTVDESQQEQVNIELLAKKILELLLQKLNEVKSHE